MQKTLPMHLNTSPACFEGSGTGKHEQMPNTLTNLKLVPKKQLGGVFTLQALGVMHSGSYGPLG